MKQRLEGIISYELVVIHKCLLYACIITVAYICSTQYLEVVIFWMSKLLTKWLWPLNIKYLIHSTTTSRPYNVLRTMKILGTQWQSKVKKYLPSFTERGKKKKSNIWTLWELLLLSPGLQSRWYVLKHPLMCYHSNRKQTILKSEYYESKAHFITSCFPLDKKRHSSHTFRLYYISKSKLSCQH